MFDDCDEMDIEGVDEEGEEEFREDLREHLGIVVKNVIGKGCKNVIVYLAEKDGKYVAVKRFDMRNGTSEEDRRAILEEARAMKDLHESELFLSLYHVRNTFSYTAFVMEFCEGGDLLKRIQTSGTFAEIDAQNISRQLLEALAIMHHEKDMCHRDIKLENILLQAREGLRVRLADMGTVARSHSKRRRTFKGTYATMAPEIKRRMCPKGGPSMSGRSRASSLTTKATYDGQRADMYSVGVVIYCMIKGHYPKGSLRAIMLDTSMSLDARNLIVSLLTSEPSRRPTAKAALRHDWIRGSFSDSPTVTIFDRDTPRGCAVQ